VLVLASTLESPRLHEAAPALAATRGQRSGNWQADNEIINNSKKVIL